MAQTKRAQTKTQTKTQTKKNKRGGMMSFLRKMRGQTANSENLVHGFGITNDEGEMIPDNGKIMNPLLNVSRLPFKGNNFSLPNARVVGVGSTKTVWVTPREKKWVRINSNLEQMEHYTKQDMINDYIFSLKLHYVDAGFFPEVVPIWRTPRKLVYNKELCRQIKNETMTVQILKDIIEAAQLLMERHLLFTFDLKPENLGYELLYGNINFIDFGLENSYKLKDNATPKTKKNYVAFSILILLVFCYLHTPIKNKEIRELAQLHIPIKKYNDAFKKFNSGRPLKTANDKAANDKAANDKSAKDKSAKPKGYYPLFDPNIDVQFNFPDFNPEAVDPSIIRRLVEPYQFLEKYGSTVTNPMEGGKQVNIRSLDDLVRLLY